MKLQHKLLIATSFLAAISFNAVADSESKPCNSKSIKDHYTSMLTKGLSSVGGVAIDSVSTNYFDGDQIVTQIGDRTRDGVTSYNTTTGNYVYTTYTSPLLLKTMCWICVFLRS